MKVMILGPAYPLRGGIADTNESLANAFIKKGFQTKILSFKLQYPNFLFPGRTQFSEEKKPENLDIETYVNSINPINWLRSAKKINKFNPDILIIRYWLPFMSPCLGTIAGFVNKNIKVIALTDNILPHENRLGDKILTKYFVKNIDAFITMSNTVYAELEEFTSKPKINIPHPINTNLGKKTTKKEAIEFLKLDENYKYILFFGLVRKYKGLDLLIDAMSDERIKSEKIKLIVAGEFYDSPQIYTEQIVKNGIEENVIIHNKFIQLEEIKYYFSASDLSAQTYHNASQSGITQIAMNFEIPMLVTNVGGLAEVVKHNETGFVCEKNADKIAECILSFFNNENSNLLIENIKQEKIKYSWDNFVDRIINELL
jgi:glycosyltransferase involved in cell wall biosynthesis